MKITEYSRGSNFENEKKGKGVVQYTVESTRPIVGGIVRINIVKDVYLNLYSFMKNIK